MFRILLAIVLTCSAAFAGQPMVGVDGARDVPPIVETLKEPPVDLSLCLIQAPARRIRGASAGATERSRRRSGVAPALAPRMRRCPSTPLFLRAA